MFEFVVRYVAAVRAFLAKSFKKMYGAMEHIPAMKDILQVKRNMAFLISDTRAQLIENIIGWAIGILLIAILVIGVALPEALNTIAGLNSSNMSSATSAILGLFGIFVALAAVLRVWRG